MNQHTITKAISRGIMTTDDAKLATANTLAEALDAYDLAVAADATLLRTDAAIAVVNAARLHVWAMQVHGVQGLEALAEIEDAEVE